jgi:hypothetical protein
MLQPVVAGGALRSGRALHDAPALPLFGAGDPLCTRTGGERQNPDES